MKRLTLVLGLALLSGCGTNPPTAPPPPDTGRVFVSANVDSAQIYLDGQFTGRIAPDTIVATIGEHVIRLERTGYFSVSQVVQVQKDTVVRVQLVMSIESGRIFVWTSTPGCLIVLDGASTGLLTPDTLRVAVGQHTVRVEKPGYQAATVVRHAVRDSTITASFTLLPGSPRVVVIEDFSNVSCVPCIASNVMLERLTNQVYGRSQLVAVKYATNFPSPADPFYRANPGDANARIGYYNIISAPTMIVDGGTRYLNTDSARITGNINARLLQTPKFWIMCTSEILGSIYSTRVRVWTLDTAGLDFSQLVLHTVVTEAEVEFASPPGSNGETRFFDVMRAMLPTNAGAAVAPGTQAVEYHMQRAIDPAWNASRLRTVSFIQHRQTREIMQTGSTF